MHLGYIIYRVFASTLCAIIGKIHDNLMVDFYIGNKKTHLHENMYKFALWSLAERAS